MQNNDNYSGTGCFVKAGVTGLSGAATTISTGSTTLQYAIAGAAYSKTQISGGTTPTTDVDTAAAVTLTTASTARVVVWMLDTSGNLKMQAGSVVNMDASGNLLKAAPLPDIDLDTYCPIATTLLKAGATLAATFTVGVSNWNQTGMTYSTVDRCSLPVRPIAS